MFHLCDVLFSTIDQILEDNNIDETKLDSLATLLDTCYDGDGEEIGALLELAVKYVTSKKSQSKLDVIKAFINCLDGIQERYWVRHIQYANLFITLGKHGCKSVLENRAGDIYYNYINYYII